jgi:hypothetical protein
MEEVAIMAYNRDNYEKKTSFFEYHLDLRYNGQEHSVKLKLKV